ncbi:hypothetical protein ACFWMS_20565 [Peribacillus butanolivorans]|uniref:hypothetical protein n=1 Tax=Peribacillus butanolivorans TaxID=421767 RepID=UPI00365B460B
MNNISIQYGTTSSRCIRYSYFCYINDKVCADRTTELSHTMDAAIAGKQALLDAINYTSLVTIGLAIVATIFSLFIRKHMHEEI